MKLGLKLLSLIILAGTALASTYTTTANGCGAKNVGYCTLSVVDQNNQPFTLTLDLRVNGTGPIDTLAVSYPYPGAKLFSVHGTYSGFVANPNGTRQPYYGSGSFVSDDQTVNGTFSFYAYYVGTCSGRGCGGTLGWHFQILSGSTVTTE
jgi:hypothetical protein